MYKFKRARFRGLWGATSTLFRPGLRWTCTLYWSIFSRNRAVFTDAARREHWTLRVNTARVRCNSVHRPSTLANSHRTI